MGLFGGGGGGSAKAAMGYMNQIAPMETKYYHPYIEHGDQAYNYLSPQYNSMTSDPAGFLEKLMGSYMPSRSFQLKKDQMLKAAGNTAAAGGMRGSINDISDEARITDMLMGEDMQQWLQNVLGIQKSGMMGEQGLYNTGYDATKSLTGDLSNVYGNMGQLAFQGSSDKNKSKSDMMSGLGTIAGGIAGAYFGGPAGAAAGASIGGSLGSSLS